MWAVVLVVILVTYWRLAPDTRLATDDLYHVSGNGVAGGLSRVLIETNFPIAVVGACSCSSPSTPSPAARGSWPRRR